MAISYVGVGASAAGTTSITPAYPATPAAGDLFVLCVVAKYAANTPSTPAGWTLQNQVTGGAGTDGTADEGYVNVTIFTKVSDGSESGTETVTISGANSSIAYIAQYNNGTGNWGTATTTGTDTTANTAISMAGAGDPGVTAGDWLLVLAGFNSDAYGYGSRSMSQSGITAWTAHTERVEVGTNTGTDLDTTLTDHSAQTGTSSGVPTFTETAGGSATYSPCGAGVFLRLREIAGTITGTLAITLDDVTISSTGKVAINGTLSKTLDATTLSSTGTVKITGQLSKTLDDVGLSATGSVKITGTLSKTLDDTSISSTGKIAIAGALAKTLDAVGINSTGTVSIAGTLAKTLDDVGISSSGKVTITGSLSKTLDDVTILATGGTGTIITGTLTKTLDDVTIAAAGKVYVSGALAKTLDDVVISASSKALINGTLAQTLDDTGIVAAGIIDISGMLAQTLEGVTLSGSGTVKIVGQLSKTLDDVSIVATGTTNPITEIYEVEAEITTIRLYAGEIDTELDNQSGITMQTKKISSIDATIDHVSGIMILVKFIGRLLKG